MPISLNTFVQQARSTRFDSRDIVVDDAKTPTSVKHGNLVFSSGTKTNIATMKAFKEALRNEYGVFGLHAFDTVIGTRAQLHKSLRACDVTAVLSQIDALKSKRFANELERQMTVSPAFLELAPAVRQAVRNIVRAEAKGHTAELQQCESTDDLNKLANDTIMKAIQKAKADPLVGHIADFGISELQKGEKETPAGAPMGLSKLSGTFADYGFRTTSVEDHVKDGTMGAGMRVNFGSSLRPAIFEELKTNGVEPGFLYHDDWSADDTSSLVIDIHSQNTISSLNQFISKSPKLTTDTQGKPYLVQGLLVGRAHPAGVAFAAEYVLSKELDKLGQDPKLDSPLLKAIRQSFPNAQKTDFFPADGSQPQGTQLTNLAKLKKDCFVQLRDAVMTYQKTAAKTDPNSQLPVFKHFTERHILKLDYNEGDRTSLDKAPSSAEFRLPVRVSIKKNIIWGAFYRTFRKTTADKASIGAVSEALANDLTRLLGVAAQDLTIVRGEYSDGHPKIMLEAKFAEGYKDFDGVYIEDGRIRADVNAEALGKYKALYLALADYDAIGSHGQNKGFIGDPKDTTQQKTFFAIDPGHSLEGKGESMVIRDNLSFVRKKFNNYSIFDDDTRFHKFEGVLKLRDLRDSGAITRLFLQYGRDFNPQQPGISDAEKAIREQVMDNLLKMEKEFLGQIDKMTTACADQLSLYDALGEDPATQPLQEGAIDTIENLEKLTSPTTWKSEHGKVELKHLSVPEKTRIPWTAKKDENGMLVYTSQKPLSAEAQTRLLQQMYGAPNSAQIQIGKDGMATIKVPVGDAQHLFDAFTEDKIAKVKHPEEAQQRADVAAAKAKFQQDTTETAANLEKLTSPTTWRGAPNAPNERFLTVNQGTNIPWTVETKNGNLVFTSQQPIQDTGNNDARTRLLRQMFQAPNTAKIKFDAQDKATITVPVEQAQVFFDAFSEQKIAKVKHPTDFQQSVTQAANPPPVQQPPVQQPPVQQPPVQQPPVQQPPVQQPPV